MPTRRRGSSRIDSREPPCVQHGGFSLYGGRSLTFLIGPIHLVPGPLTRPCGVMPHTRTDLPSRVAGRTLHDSAEFLAVGCSSPVDADEGGGGSLLERFRMRRSLAKMLAPGPVRCVSSGADRSGTAGLRTSRRPFRCGPLRGDRFDPAPGRPLPLLPTVQRNREGHGRLLTSGDDCPESGTSSESGPGRTG